MKIWSQLVVLLMVVVLGGCTSMFNAKPIPGIPQPADRLNHINELGKAKNIPEEQQQEYAQTLSTIIHEDSDSTMRRAAVMAITNFHLPLTEETLRFAEKDSERDVREAACIAWKKYGGDVAVQELILILANESDLDIRHQAIESLGELKDERAIVALEVPLMDNDPALQHFTMISLQKISGEPKKTREEWIAWCQARHPDTEVAFRDEKEEKEETKSPFLDIQPEKQF